MGPPVADQPTQDLVMIAFVVDHLIQDANAGLVAKFLELFRVLGDVAAFVQLQTPQGDSNTPGAIGNRVCVAAFWTVIDRVGAFQRANAVRPKLSMVKFRPG